MEVALHREVLSPYASALSSSIDDKNQELVTFEMVVWSFTGFKRKPKMSYIVVV